MPDHHRHDDFIRALIFSMIINLLMVFALVAQRGGKMTTRFLPFVVSIEASHTALPRHPLAKAGASAIPQPVKIVKTNKSRPSFAPPARVEAVLTQPEDAEVAVSRPVMPTDLEMKGSDPPLLVTEGATIASAEETAGGTALALARGDYIVPLRVTGEDPSYPKWAERRGWEGRVLLSLLINDNGEVEKVEIVKTSGYELLDHQARESVAAWRFKSARRDGMAVAVTVQQEIIFRRPLAGHDK